MAEIAVGDVYETELGETLEITNERGDEICIHHPEREATAETVWRLRESVEKQIEYENMKQVEDGSVDESPEPLGSFTDKAPPNCPVCGSFMDCREQDGMGLPTAVCTQVDCHGWMDDRQLIDGGYFKVQ